MLARGAFDAVFTSKMQTKACHGRTTERMMNLKFASWKICFHLRRRRKSPLTSPYSLIRAGGFVFTNPKAFFYIFPHSRGDRRGNGFRYNTGRITNATPKGDNHECTQEDQRIDVGRSAYAAGCGRSFLEPADGGTAFRGP
jgi:hypothetical protein